MVMAKNFNSSLGSQYPDMLYYVQNAEEFHNGTIDDFSNVGVRL